MTKKKEKKKTKENNPGSYLHYEYVLLRGFLCLAAQHFALPFRHLLDLDVSVESGLYIRSPMSESVQNSPGRASLAAHPNCLGKRGLNC